MTKLQIEYKSLPKIHICRTHGYAGIGNPCPWPDCTNGIKEGSIEFVYPSSAQVQSTFQRTEWRSITGDSYYSWSRQGTLEFFNSAGPIKQEFIRLNLRPFEEPRRVYHYTSLGLKGIVENKALWLTDYAYLNDSKELIHGKEIAARVLESLRDEVRSEQAAQFFEGWARSKRPANPS